MVLQILYVAFYLNVQLTIVYSEFFQKCSLDLQHDQTPLSVYQDYKNQKRFKRSAYYNLRIYAYYDSSFEKQKQALIYKEFIIQPAIDYLQKALRVRNPYSNIKLQRKCVTNRLAFVNINGAYSYYCADGCTKTTKCGDVIIPEEHLMGCRRIIGSELAQAGPEGPGVDNVDFILYIESKSTGKCLDPSVLAYASSCQSEAELDRPVAGYINFCPGRLSSEFGHLSQSLFIAKHELIHALGFAVTQFAFYRDRWGRPYTPRNRHTGRPNLGLLLSPSSVDQENNLSGIYKWSERVTRNEIRRWMSATGLYLKNVTMMVLPTVVKEARKYFNCSKMEGVELEDQGGLGVAITHWEKRILENDIMTATFTQEARVSRITLALLFDTGWYIPNYEIADEMHWGKNLGCDFLEMSCYEYMMEQANKGHSIKPFCDVINRPHHELSGFCSEDRHAYGYCNLQRHKRPLPPQYQYFRHTHFYDDAGYYGGKSVVANYCPYPQEFNWYKGSKVSRTTQCKEQRNNQGVQNNFLLQSFGPTSSCFALSHRWTVQYCGKKSIPNIIGAGCYEYVCSPQFGLIVIINNQSYQCPSAGDIVAIDDFNGYFSIQGALICPSCSDLCPTSSCQKITKLLPLMKSDNNQNFHNTTYVLCFTCYIIKSNLLLTTFVFVIVIYYEKFIIF